MITMNMQSSQSVRIAECYAAPGVHMYSRKKTKLGLFWLAFSVRFLNGKPWVVSGNGQ
jgi:hypothetical protein